MSVQGLGCVQTDRIGARPLSADVCDLVRNNQMVSRCPPRPGHYSRRHPISVRWWPSNGHPDRSAISVDPAYCASYAYDEDRLIDACAREPGSAMIALREG
jgi:hypothetical protein